MTDIIARALALANAKKIKNLPNGYKAKGSVPTINDLPMVGNEIGDLYVVADTGKKYAWGRSNGILRWYPVEGDNDFVEQTEFSEYKDFINQDVRTAVLAIAQTISHKGHQIPDLQLTQINYIYNAISVKGQLVVINVGDAYYLVDGVKMGVNELSVYVLFEDSLLLNYTLSNSLVNVTSVELGGVCGLVIQASADTQVSGWDIPELTSEQVTQAYNALVAGKSVTIENADGDLQFKALIGDATYQSPSILMQYYWLGWVEYQVSASTIATALAHKVPEEQLHKITNVTIGADTIDVVIS